VPLALLTEIALEEAVHELLKGDTLYVLIRRAEVDRFKVGHDDTECFVVDANGIGEDV